MRKVTFLLLFTFLTSFWCFAQTYTIKNGSAKFTTSAETFGVDSQFEGVGNGLNGTINLTDSTFNFTFDLIKLQTGIKLRDNHMHEDYLETETYPKASFSGKLKATGKFGEVLATGDFSMHGNKKKVTATGSLLSNRLKATWKLNLKDFKIEIPEKFMIGKISEILSMSVDAVLIEEKR
ncbi:MAG: YceI family protein [Bacteroidetes bacterium]|nr:YceI family protein [Bacteroidota bacterium]